MHDFSPFIGNPVSEPSTISVLFGEQSICHPKEPLKRKTTFGRGHLPVQELRISHPLLPRFKKSLWPNARDTLIQRQKFLGMSLAQVL
jgi:hypothetical protein